MDNWPLSDPMCVVADPAVAWQITHKHSLPKHPTLATFLKPLLGPKTLISMEGQEWKHWRSLFNPGFSTSHLMSLVEGMIDDCMIFCEVLSKHAEKGEMFQMEEAATRLTIDIIARVVL